MVDRPIDPQDPLALLRAHLRDAQDAAQRLMREATETPASGWESLDPTQATQTAQQVNSLSELLHSLGELLPEDLRAELAELIRQLLAVARALLDLLLSRLNGAASKKSSEIQDIPIL
jgi:hypothetical protein